MDRLAKNVGFTDSDSAALTRDIARQVNTQSGQRFTNSLGEEQREQFSESATQAITAQNTYQHWNDECNGYEGPGGGSNQQS